MPNYASFRATHRCTVGCWQTKRLYKMLSEDMHMHIHMHVCKKLLLVEPAFTIFFFVNISCCNNFMRMFLPPLVY